eukprot:SAG11_NODE_17456_length_518_cov_0.995227_1_plen_78_part_00
MGSIGFAVTALFSRGHDAPFHWDAPNPEGYNTTFAYDGPSWELLHQNMYPVHIYILAIDQLSSVLHPCALVADAHII